MKIDTHQHFWHYRERDFPWITSAMPQLCRDRMPADVAPELLAAQVDAVVVVQARCDHSETDFLLEIAEHQPSVVGVVGWVDLTSDTVDATLDHWSAHAKLKGMRHLLQDEVDVVSWLGQSTVYHNIRALQARKLTYDVLVFQHQLPLVSAFCAQHDKHWLVLDHLGKPRLREWRENPRLMDQWERDVRVLAQLSHVMCKLSGLVTETDWPQRPAFTAADETHVFRCFDVALNAFGPERLLFGSDWPVCTLAASYDTVHTLAQRWATARLTRDQQDAFWSGNAIRVYDLKR